MATNTKSALIGVGIAALLALAGCTNVPVQSPAERMLFESSNGAVYKAMKRGYPDQYADLLIRVERMIAGGRSPRAIDGEIARFMIGAEARLKPEIRQAGHTTIAKYRRAEIEAIAALQAADPRLCAHYIAEGGLMMPYKHAKVDAAIANQHALGWEAAAEGRDHPVGRLVTPPTKEDWAAIDKAMIGAGLSKALVRQFFDPATARLLSAELQCSTGLAFHKAIEALPDDRADIFYFAMMDSA